MARKNVGEGRAEACAVALGDSANYYSEALEGLLKNTWDERKFHRGCEAEDAAAHAGAAAEAEAQNREGQNPAAQIDPDFSPDLVTAAVTSPRFWLYTTMCSSLHGLVHKLSAWSEGCDCHPWSCHEGPDPDSLTGNHADTSASAGACSDSLSLSQGQGIPDLLRATKRSLGWQEEDGDGKHFVCPLAGQRAVDLASGALWMKIDSLSDECKKDILLSAGSGCDADILQAVLADFSFGLSCIVEVLKSKLLCWETLPWQLAALNEPVFGQGIAKQALARYDASPQEPWAHHRLTQKFFALGSAGRRELEAYASGAPLEDLLQLRDFVWGLRFMPTAERVVEGEHAITKRHIGQRGRLSGAFISTRLRFGELLACLDDPAQKGLLLEWFARLKADTDELAIRCGFSKHPLWEEANRHRYKADRKRQIAGNILYCLEPTVQFDETTAGAKHKRKKHANEKAKRVTSTLDKVLHGQRAARWSAENVEIEAIAHHLQTRLQIGKLYSMSHTALQLTSLESALRHDWLSGHAGGRAVGNALGALQSDEALRLAVEAAASANEASSALVPRAPTEALTLTPQHMDNVCFFRVVTARPSKRKRVPLPAAEAKRMSLCVAIEPQCAVGVANHIAVLSFGEGVHGRNAVNMLEVKDSLRGWRTEKKIVYALKHVDLTPSGQQLLDDFVSA